jgi:hypothetical protein
MPRGNGPMVGCGLVVALIAAGLGWAILFLAPDGGNDLLVKELGLNPREEALQTIVLYSALWSVAGFAAGCVIYLIAAK